jgi:hypothetical protein
VIELARRTPLDLTADLIDESIEVE